MLKRRLRLSICLRENIYLTDEIDTPFVIGLVKPRIFLPSNLSEQELEYVILHEQMHIRRWDMLVKAAAYFITLVHWFNPLAWVAFFCMGKDMEMSCDEAVVRHLGVEKEAEYAETLLRLSVGKQRLQGIALAFGEGNTKDRVKNIMKYKKPLMITGVFAVLVIVALIVGLLTDPKSEEQITETTVTAEQETGQTKPDVQVAVQGIPVEISTPQVSPDMLIGVQGTLLDYAGDDIIIFHDYYGLFVFSTDTGGMKALGESEIPYGIVRSVDLAAIGCGDTQGSNSCDVKVSKDGSTVYLHPMEKDYMYVYDVEKHTLIEQKYSYEGLEFFDSYAEPDKLFELGACSYKGVVYKGQNGNPDYYGYLTSYDYTLGNLCYVVDDMIFPIFETRAVEVPEKE